MEARRRLTERPALASVNSIVRGCFCRALRGGPSVRSLACVVFELSSELLIFMLRLALLGLLYLFLAMVVLSARRDLRQAAEIEAPARRQPAQLLVLDPGQTSLTPGEALALGPTTSLGRAKHCTIVLDDTFVSSEHAVVEYRAGRWWLVDRGSTNGTLLNGRPIQGEVGVNAADVIGIGDVQLRLVV